MNSDNEHMQSMLAFSVDTHLLRELGALLVGRDSTALVELIKNAYDADATGVVIYGASLADHGTISVQDDGHGMTYRDFSEKFLRIAGRSKEGGARRSPRYGRKYTGAKGIGRLSAHKLGERLALESTPDRSVLGRSLDDGGVQASIDWSQIEQSTDSIDQAKLIRAAPVSPGSKVSGTDLHISNLHSRWSTRQLNEFLAEVRSTRPDEVMWSPLSRSKFDEPLLLPEIRIADSGKNDPGFSIELSGEFGGSASQWPTLLSHIAWLIEIDARATEVVYRITPSRQFKRIESSAGQREFRWSRPSLGPIFAARLLVRGGDSFPRILNDTLTTFANSASGVRIYFEGFRVLPYGSPRNDWLGLDRAYSARAELDLIEDFAGEIAKPSEDVVNERTYRLSNKSYFGAIFLHDTTSSGLQMVVNREGFLPTEEFSQIADIVSRGVNLNTRMRAALGAARKQRKKDEQDAERATKRRALLSSGNGERSTAPQALKRPGDELRSLLELGQESAAALRISTPGGRESAALREHATIVETVLEEMAAVSSAASEEQSQLRVLASLGTQLGAFVHEVNSLVGQARSISSALAELLASELAGSTKRQLNRIARSQADLLVTLERQAVYLSDSFGAESRRRRTKQRVAERWATASRLLSSAASRRSVEIIDDIPGSLRTLPMFSAELNIVLTNLLSNAVKAATADDSLPRVVRATGEDRDGHVCIRIENTGLAVDLSESERWFMPFETTTSEMDEVLGQGLGLGLTLTRRIVEDYGGEISFVRPSSSMSTAIQVLLPGN